jgi:tyrosyl-tRNA synthetase
MNELFCQSPTLQRTAADIITAADLRARMAGGRQLRIKYGMDVTAPFLHIGHGVNLWAMRELQQAGHKVMLLIGDFTTRIGDPTGRSATRPVIPAEQIERDADAFIEQAGHILLTDPAVFEVRRNSEWWSPMRLESFDQPAVRSYPRPADPTRHVCRQDRERSRDPHARAAVPDPAGIRLVRAGVRPHDRRH